jgi:hypothetical protein
MGRRGPTPSLYSFSVDDRWGHLGSGSHMSIDVVADLGAQSGRFSVKLWFELILFLNFRFYVNLLNSISHAR